MRGGQPSGPPWVLDPGRSNDIERYDRAQRGRCGFSRILAGLGRTGPASGLTTERAAIPGVELRAERTPCLLSRRRPAGMEALERSSAASKEALRFASPRGWRGSLRFSINSLQDRSWLCRTTVIRVSRDSPTRVNAAAGEPCVGSPWPTPQAGSRCAAWPT